MSDDALPNKPITDATSTRKASHIPKSKIEPSNNESSNNLPLEERLKRRFEKKYIYYEDVLDVLLNGLATIDDNELIKMVLLWGRGGYGKSSMAWDFVDEVLSGDQSKIFLQSFGISTTEDKLYGGISLKSMREEDAIRFRLQNSWLAYSLPIMEELFDLPGALRDDLKDTISRGSFMRGDEIFKAVVNCMIICTNRNPADIERESASAEALIQRCDLELKVEWPRHEVADYKLMLEKQRPDYASLAPIIANLVQSCQNKGEKKPVTPRVAVKALDTVIRQARKQKRQYVIDNDLLSLKFAKPFCRNVTLLKETIPDVLKAFGGFLTFNRIQSQAEAIIKLIEGGVSELRPEKVHEMAADLNKLQEDRKNTSLPSEGEAYKMSLDLAKRITEALKKI